MKKKLNPDSPWAIYRNAGTKEGGSAEPISSPKKEVIAGKKRMDDFKMGLELRNKTKEVWE
jgi:hypothetical protein